VPVADGGQPVRAGDVVGDRVQRRPPAGAADQRPGQLHRGQLRRVRVERDDADAVGVVEQLHEQRRRVAQHLDALEAADSRHIVHAGRAPEDVVAMFRRHGDAVGDGGS